MKMIQENICDECDAVVHSIVDSDEFFAAKAGAVVCPECGHVIMPCNECEFDHVNQCANCPYKKTSPQKGKMLTDEEYVTLVRENEPETFAMMLKGDMGKDYQRIAKGINAKKQ